MANPSKGKGTKAERALATVLARLIFPDADRRTLGGRFDKGDILGTPGVCFEAKDAKVWKVPEWMRQTEAERVNAKADFGILVIKMPKVGYPNADRWLTVMDDDAAWELSLKAKWSREVGTGRPWGFGSKRAVYRFDAVDKALSVQTTGVERLILRERHCAPTPVIVQLKQRVSEHCDGKGFWNLMRLDARCDMLLDAGYGRRAIIDETV